ncbi:MAG TPA: hypothetical protein VHW45_08415 [Candidatus Sulfotelmatobacter sp.]|nr:hypothetical protein [Candidatus Sulfotelmatobacter sp.]
METFWEIAAGMISIASMRITIPAETIGPGLPWPHGRAIPPPDEWM